MRAITLFRAFAWLGVAVVFWSLNIRWGEDLAVRNGPPENWQRAVVGAALLSLLSAIAMSVSGRGENPPRWIARGIAAVAAVGILVIAMVLRHIALERGMGVNYLGGQGWTWLLSGGGLAFGAAIGSFGLTRPEEKNAVQSSKKRRARRKG